MRSVNKCTVAKASYATWIVVSDAQRNDRVFHLLWETTPQTIPWVLCNFTNPKKGKTSHCYRVTYRSMDRSLTDEEINALQVELREKTESELGVELR